MKHIGYTRLTLVALLILSGWLIADSVYRKQVMSPLEAALQSAGNNRKELDKVLCHYQENPADSLKYKAACFLLKSMPYYYSYAPNETIDSLKRLKVENKDRKIDAETIKKWKWFHYQELPKVRDVDVITADLLIENIEYAFKAWNERRWKKNYSFEQFCEYILPYRLGDEPLEKWRKIYYDRYSPVLDSLYKGSDVVEAAKRMTAYLQSETFANRTDFELPHMGALFLLKNRVGYCRDGCDIASYVMRSLGIPIAMDMYCVSPSYRSRHFWSAVIDTTGLAVPFNYHEFLPERGMNDDRKRGKVYRCFFSAREMDESVLHDENVPELFRDRFWRDVTGEYYPDNGFDVVLESGAVHRHVYLSVYDFDKYVPIDMAVVNGKVARFRNVENGLVYFPVFYEKGRTYPAGYPFLLKEGSVPFYFIPNPQERCKVALTRKYPMRSNYQFLAGAVGLRFEGSETPDFRQPKLLHEVVDTPLVNYNKVRFPRPVACRYIRVSQDSERMELAEFEIYSGGRKIEVRKWGRKMDKLHRNPYEKRMFDGVWENYVVTFGEPLFFDIGKDEQLTAMVFMPRNDDNFIHLGDAYELFYHNGKEGWTSLGKQLADTTCLCYDNIPVNSMLWLHNSSRGKEERSFYMEDGKQVFP